MVSRNVTGNPECPDCGSENTRQVTGPTEPMKELDNIDLERAGTYACDHCQGRFAYEAIMAEFSPTAKCVHCDSFDTIILRLSTRTRNLYRYHLCKTCGQSFRTMATDRNSHSSDNESLRGT